MTVFYKKESKITMPTNIAALIKELGVGESFAFPQEDKSAVKAAIRRCPGVLSIRESGNAYRVWRVE